MERVVAVLLHVPTVERIVYTKSCVTCAPSRHPHSTARTALLMQVEGMVDMLYGYAPALFISGCQDRDCHRGCHTNSNIRTMLYSRCLHLLLPLPLGYERKVEYVPTLMVARLFASSSVLFTDSASAIQ